MPVYIYGLIDPGTNKIRYIGKTAQYPPYRLTQHMRYARLGYRSHVSSWLRQLMEEDAKPNVRILEVLDSDVEWQSVEQFWIAHGHQVGWPLTNSTAGGEGIPNPSPEICQERSERMKGNRYAIGNRNAAGKRSEAFRHRMAEVAKVTRNRTGKPVSSDVRKRISEKLMGHETVKGEDNGQSVLTEEQVREIRAAYAAGGISYAKIAKRYGVTRSCIGHIVRKANWRHVLQEQ